MSNSSFFLWLAAVYLTVISLTISVIDARRLIIPNVLNAANAGGGFVFALVGTVPFLASLIGSALGFITLLTFRAGYRNVRGQEGIGLGDVKFMIGAGFWVGWYGLAPLLLVASLSALLFLLLRWVSNGHFDPQRELPFGPFLCIGTLTVWTMQTTGFAPWIIP